ncbi:hypothetical protein GH714_036804 [Hevea brasiliensis]|uniref:Uncharacterized protein n=1 Tax=Hevea brasiliensis TaxID=3981 RepID=A0A6A6NF58_HEVBR|nr:hypothetical protein GH714_036804 [Hevea brasiliensis]
MTSATIPTIKILGRLLRDIISKNQALLKDMRLMLVRIMKIPLIPLLESAEVVETEPKRSVSIEDAELVARVEDASFKQSLPSQVRAPGVFRCIRVTAISGGEAEVAYQAIVNISGHVFKGFLYDQGIDEKNLFPCISKIPPVRRNRDSTSPIVDPPYAYPASASYRFLEGIAYSAQ